MRWLFACVLVGCGGSIASIDGADGGGATDAGADASSGDASSSDAGSRPDSPQQACAQQLAELDAIRQATRKCCPTCHSDQCTVKVDDLCCAISATNTQAAQLMTDAVNKYKAQCGPIACPATPCAPAPSGVCEPSTSLCR